MLVATDMRSWVPEDDMVHFVLEAVEAVPLTDFRVNETRDGLRAVPAPDAVRAADLLLRQWHIRLAPD